MGLLNPTQALPMRRWLPWSLLPLGAGAAVAARVGFEPPILPVGVLLLVQVGLLLAYGVALPFVFRSPDPVRRLGWWGAWRRAVTSIGRKVEDAQPPTAADGVLLVVLPIVGLGLWGTRWSDVGVLLLDAAAMAAALLALGRGAGEVLRRSNAPGLLLPLTFLFIIVLGTMLLKLPVCHPHTALTWTDALFTSTSAVCVTGLTVRSTAADFSPAGQAVIAGLIQTGGLGIVLFGAMYAWLLSGRLSLRERVSVRDALEHRSLADVRNFIATVLLSVLVIELIGAAALYALWPAQEGETPGQRVGHAVFHAISAFCNAGFDLTGSSLTGLRTHATTQVVMALLIVTGGLGFPLLMDLGNWCRVRLTGGVRRGLSLHSKITLLTTLGVHAIGAGAIFGAQAGVADTGVGLLTHAADANFMAISSRTAGFNSVAMTSLAPASIVMIAALMFVGGSPGSTAGGTKTTTLGVLVLSVVATIRGRAETEAFGRAIPEALVRRAGAVAVCMIALVLGASVVLCASEQADPAALVFESISAATTTGLSLGVTPTLSDPGKLIVAATMFLGRVGPLALLGVLVVRKAPSRRYLYPREDLTLG